MVLVCHFCYFLWESNEFSSLVATEKSLCDPGQVVLTVSAHDACRGQPDGLCNGHIRMCSGKSLCVLSNFVQFFHQVGQSEVADDDALQQLRIKWPVLR